MFKRVLVANRGAVAARLQRALREMSIVPVMVHSEADAELPYIRHAEEAHCIGPAPVTQSYLNAAVLLEVARKAKVDALHPGYGFLSEKAAFASAVEESGFTFIGPPARWLEAMGHKTRARDLMVQAGMPVAPSSPVLEADLDVRVAQADAMGYPLLVKPAGGGGGIGMIAVHGRDELRVALDRAAGLAQRMFACADVYVERLIEKPRHVEIQILADRHGNVAHLFERDCSVQRRHQKVVEEAAAPGIDRSRLDELADRSAHVLSQMGYQNIGTVETLYSEASGFSFLEMNTRLQVEHGVTEAITGIDIVHAQVRLAHGAKLMDVLHARPSITGHALQLRIYAEDPVRFMPSPGELTHFDLPRDGVRVETGYARGNRVTPFYDPMLAKLIVHGTDRAEAIARALDALAAVRIEGVKHNVEFLKKVLRSEAFVAGAHDTGLAKELASV
ncbi:MAG TPA: biotin carboxylase N-terminal domain-containing protein [Burkholderiales bacterium]|nr:biotin carboxylase N-terminal domain-containing protein [Burkholderiales bacterium]